jgi:hypothetical protein
MLMSTQAQQRGAVPFQLDDLEKTFLKLAVAAIVPVKTQHLLCRSPSIPFEKGSTVPMASARPATLICFNLG